MRSVFGVYVPSNRPASAYQQVGQIPTAISSPEQLINQYEGEFQSRWAGGHTGFSATYRLKESLIALAMFGYGNNVVGENAEYIQIFEGFEGVLRQVLPRSLKFEHIRIAIPEVVLETGTGSFSLDAASGGITTLIDLAWRIFMRARANPEIVVVVDEPENHLHPELQRELFPGLLEAFPQAQLIVATHNPLLSVLYLTQMSMCCAITMKVRCFRNFSTPSTRLARRTKYYVTYSALSLRCLYGLSIVLTRLLPSMPAAR